MPKYYEDKEEDNRACAGIKEDFKACLLQHDCVLKVRTSTNGIIVAPCVLRLLKKQFALHTHIQFVINNWDANKISSKDCFN